MATLGIAIISFWIGIILGLPLSITSKATIIGATLAGIPLGIYLRRVST